MAAACTDFRVGPVTSPSIADASADSTPMPDEDARTSAIPIKAVTGGACLSGANGATGVRILFKNVKGEALATREKFGLPEDASFKASAYTVTGDAAEYGDPNFGGGADIRGDGYVDIHFSTRGLPPVRTATIAIRARSLDTGDSGSFAWQVGAASGNTKPDGISVVPYAWICAEITDALPIDDKDALLRLKAGPTSMALCIDRIELCLDAPVP